MTDKETNVSVARERWGAAAPEWVMVLAAACDAPGSSQAAIAKRMGVSAAMVNTTLKNAYTGRYDKLSAKVRGELMNEKVTCPVLGEISTRRCLDEQTRAGKGYSPTNSTRVELRRACPACPHSRNEKEAA